MLLLMLLVCVFRPILIYKLLIPKRTIKLKHLGDIPEPSDRGSVWKSCLLISLYHCSHASRPETGEMGVQLGLGLGRLIL